VDRSSAEGVLVEAPKAPRGVSAGGGRGYSPPVREVPPSPPGERSGEGLKNFVLFDLKTEHFGAVFKLEGTQLQEKAIFASCLTLATPEGGCFFLSLSARLF